jgi:hypothetical protein
MVKMQRQITQSSFKKVKCAACVFDYMGEFQLAISTLRD